MTSGTRSSSNSSRSSSLAAHNLASKPPSSVAASSRRGRAGVPNRRGAAAGERGLLGGAGVLERRLAPGLTSPPARSRAFSSWSRVRRRSPLCYEIFNLQNSSGGGGLPSGRVPVGDLQGATQTVADFLRTPPTIATEHPFTLDQMQRSTLRVYEELLSQTHIQEPSGLT